MDTSSPLQAAIPAAQKRNGHIKAETSHSSGPLSPQNSPTCPTTLRKLSRDSTLGPSPGSTHASYEDRDEGRVSVKRACNECRQQKLRCNVVQEPFSSCTRCKKGNLECRIDANFKRVGKRKRNAEMEEELNDLRKQLAKNLSPVSDHTPASASNHHAAVLQSPASLVDYMESHDVVGALVDMKRGIGGSRSSKTRSRKLDDVFLSGDGIEELFDIFFKYYRPYQPLVDSDKSPNWYYDVNHLLFWTIIAIGARHYEPDPTLLESLAKPVSKLMWATVAEVPQSYYVVKALCLLCVWPLPISSTSSDSTMMIAGLMIQIARQIGLHRPSHAQDFSKFKVELREEELRDRVKTWAACNVVAQRVATGYGQPALSAYDWTLAPMRKQEDESRPAGFKLPEEMNARLRIEQYVDKVTRILYNNTANPVGLADAKQKPVVVSVLIRDLEQLEDSFKDHSDIPAMNTLYIRAAALHLHLSVFFDSPTTETYNDDLRALWFATSNFLQQAFGLETQHGAIIKFATNYILQVIIAAGFVLLKLLNSSFVRHIDFNHGRALFIRTVETIRLISITSHDLPSRLAEVLVQLWRTGDAARRGHKNPLSGPDHSLQLKVKCRMSMSLVFDSVWRWRQEFSNEGYAKLEAALNNPTNPEYADSFSTSGPATARTPQPPDMPPFSKPIDATLAPPSSTGISRGTTPAFLEGFGEWNNEVFDPLSWTLDGLVELPFPIGPQPMEFDPWGWTTFGYFELARNYRALRAKVHWERRSFSLCFCHHFHSTNRLRHLDFDNG
ncbi:MAG: hypothetical protein LQ340_001057 [Diploschistes diacapsis]|nr:MAG: hypothetical protein LQ340_001057 [Diploschistes diacapsis]